MNVRINGRDEPKHELQVRLDEAMLRLGEEVCLGEALGLGKPKSAEIRASSSPKHRDLRLGGDPRLGVHSYT